MKFQSQQYRQEIIDNAKRYGYKAANLMFLEKVTGAQATIPTIYPINNSRIVEHLASTNFQSEWSEFQTLMRDKVSLTEEAKVKLANIRQIIINHFNNNPIDLGINIPNELLMVRSTSNEDEVGSANQGGNDSFPSNKEELQATIGQVVASYFGERSMSQRLQSKEDVTSKLPLMACLIQKMVGVVEDEHNNSKFVSGVIFTDNGRIRIQAAPGHGKLVVDGLGNVDSFYVTKDDLIYSEIREKKNKIVPSYNAETHKIILSERENNFETKISPSLDEAVIKRMAIVGRDIANEYNMQMDIEFVYDKEADTINIVQARSRKIALEFSALSNQFISEKSPRKLKGKVITLDVMKATFLKKKENILICNNIEEALKQYEANSHSQEIKAIIVRESALSNSHAAGLFTQLEVPVLQINKPIEEIKAWVDSFDKNSFVIDPQHSGLYKINIADAKPEIIVEGIFKSTLTSAVTAMRKDFIAPNETKFSHAMPSIGNVVNNANLNRDSAHELFGYLHNIVRFPGVAYNEQNLKKDLELIEFPQVQTQDSNQKKALQNILGYLVPKLKKAKLNSIAQELVITGGKLYQELENTKIYSEDKLKDYLDVYNKFFGLVYEQREKGILSDSVVSALAEYKKDKKYLTIASEKGMSPEAANIFKDVAKLETCIINESEQNKWLEFCSKCCIETKKQAKLSYIIKSLVSLNAHEYWLNTEFTQAETISIDDVFDRIRAAEVKLIPVKAAEKLIDKLEHQIGQWNEPAKFLELHSNFRDQLSEISAHLKAGEKSNDQLSVHATYMQLNRLVDIFDNSIKTLQTSSLYSDKNIQAKNFKVLIVDFYNLMKEHLVSLEGVENLAERINSLDCIFDKEATKEDLMISNNFSVINTDLYQNSLQGFIEGWRSSLITTEDASEEKSEFIQNNKYLKPLITLYTLADFHSFVHQTMISSVSLKAGLHNKILIQVQPDILITINEYMGKTRSHSDISSTFDFMPINDQEKIKEFIKDTNLSSSLRGININNGNLTYDYNTPLAAHSLNLKLIYNIHKKQFKFNYSFCGQNDGGKRWRAVNDHINYIINVKTEVQSLNINYNNNELSWSFEASNIKGDQITDLLRVIDNIALSSNSLDLLMFLGNSPEVKYFDTAFYLYGREFASEILNPIKKERFIEDLSLKYPEYSEEIKRRVFSNNNFLLLLNSKTNIINNDIKNLLELCTNTQVDINKIFDKALVYYKKGKEIDKDNFYKLLTILEKSPESFDKLTSSNVLNVYFYGIKLEELNQILIESPERFDKLTSSKSLDAYRCGIKLEELDKILIESPERFDKLTSSKALDAYRCGIKLEKLNEILIESPERFDKLTSSKSLDAYSCGIKLEELDKILIESPERFDKLTSSKFLDAYRCGIKLEKQNEILIESPERFDKLTSSKALDAYRCGIKLEKLNEILIESPERFDKLTSSKALDAYRRGIKLEELDKILIKSPESFDKLTSSNVLNTYFYGIKLEELDKILIESPERFDRLTSSNVLNVYFYGIKLEELNQILIESPERFDKLTSFDVLNDYSRGIKLEELNQLLIEDPDRFDIIRRAYFICANTQINPKIKCSQLVTLSDKQLERIVKYVRFDQLEEEELVKDLNTWINSEKDSTDLSETIKLESKLITNYIKEASGYILDDDDIWKEIKSKVKSLDTKELRVEVISNVMNQVSNTSRRERLLSFISPQERIEVMAKVSPTVLKVITQFVSSMKGDQSSNSLSSNTINTKITEQNSKHSR